MIGKVVLWLVLLICLSDFASAGVVYNSFYPRIVVSGDEYQTIPDIYNDLVGQYGESFTQENILNETSPKIWISKVYLISYSHIYVNSSTVDELRLSNAYQGFGLSGQFEFNDAELNSWNITSNTYMDFPGHTVIIHENITNSKLYNLGTIYLGYTDDEINGKEFRNITIKNAYIGITARGNNLTFNNITIQDGHPIFGNGFRRSFLNNSVISNIYIHNVSDYTSPSSGAYGMQIGGDYNTIHDVHINGTSWSGTNLGGTFLNMYDITVDNSGHNGFEFQMRDSIVENVTVRNSDSNNFFSAIGAEDDMLRVHNITYKNIVGVDTGSGYNVRISEGSTDVLIDGADLTGDGIMISESQNVTVINMTQNDGYAGVYSTYAVAGNILNANHALIDSTFHTNVYRDIWLYNSSDTYLLNANYTSFNLNYGSYTKNYYADINVVDENGTAIEDATVIISNATYPSMNGLGILQSIFTSIGTGYTPLPNENRSNSPAVSYSYTNTSTTVYPIYSISVSKSGYNTNSSVTLTANENWYRDNPDTHQNTTTIMLSGWGYDSTKTYSGVLYTYNRLEKTIKGRNPLQSDNIINIMFG